MKLKKAKILVLGGNGFIGNNLANYLTANGKTVFKASRVNGVDLTNYQSIKRYLNKISPDVIFNCAAHVGSLHFVTTFSANVLHNNVEMSLNLYKAIAQTCPKTKVINPIPNCIYPDSSKMLTESDFWNGEVHESVYSYGNSRRVLLVLAKCYEKQYGIKSINFIIPNTFGPGDSIDANKTHALNGMIVRMINAHQKKDKEFDIWGSGTPIREWAYVKDVIKILMKSLSIKNLSVPINIAQKKSYTIRQSAEFIAEAIGFGGKIVSNAKYQDGVPMKILDDKRFRLFFPNFSFYDHKKGIAETVAYYKSIL